MADIRTAAQSDCSSVRCPCPRSLDQVVFTAPVLNLSLVPGPVLTRSFPSLPFCSPCIFCSHDAIFFEATTFAPVLSRCQRCKHILVPMTHIVDNERPVSSCYPLLRLHDYAIFLCYNIDSIFPSHRCRGNKVNIYPNLTLLE